MATNVLELATTLKYLGAKWLPGKKVNFTPCNLHVILSRVFIGLPNITSQLVGFGLATRLLNLKQKKLFHGLFCTWFYPLNVTIYIVMLNTRVPAFDQWCIA